MLKIVKYIILAIVFAVKPAIARPAYCDTLYLDSACQLSNDTMPYMIKDKAFLSALNELQKMLYVKSPYSLKRAEFLVEWAYSGGNMEYDQFCHDIDSVVQINNI